MITAEEHAAQLIESLSDEEVCRIYESLGYRNQYVFTLDDLFIITKPPDSKLVRLTPNESQQKYLQDIADCSPGFDPKTGAGALEGLRLDVLKYRQWGCSTITIGLYMLDCLNNPFTQSRVIAHNPQTTLDLITIAKTMYENAPPQFKPKLIRDSRGEMVFGNGSSMRVLLVGSQGAGRGGTVKNFLLSERAFWPSDGNEIEFGLLQSVPYGGNVVRETTANGLEDFYQHYQDAKAGRNPYRAFFYGWACHKEYSLPVPQDFQKSEEEEELARNYDLEDGQIVFRRAKSQEATSLGKHFSQEYPLNDVEAFIGSGSNYYNNTYLLKLIAEMKSEEGAELHKPLYTIEIGENGFHARFKVWKEPEQSRYYVGGADPAGGISKDGKQDHSSFHLFDLETWEEVLHYHGDPDPWDFGLDIAALAAHYNDANIAVLRINHGHEVIRALRETGCIGIVTDDDGMFGIIENTRTKPQLDDKLGTTINDMARGEPGLILHSTETIEELITYSKLPGGKAGAAGTAHDDRQSSLKTTVWQLIRDDRRYRIPPKEPPAPTISYGGRPRR